MPRKSRPWFRWNRSRTAGRWYVTKGKKQIALEVTDPSDEPAAWEALKRLINKAVSEVSGKSEPRPEPIGMLRDEFLATIEHRITAESMRRYRTHLDRFAGSFPDSTAGNLDPVALEKQAAASFPSRNTRATYLLVVQMFVRWCGLTHFRVKLPARESRGAEAVIDQATYQRLLTETVGDFRQLVRFLWATGSRQQEAAIITAEMVDWPSGTVRITEHKGKRRGKDRILFLSADGLTILKEQSDKYGSGFLFRGNRGRRLTQKAIVLRFQRLSKVIGTHVHAHQFRHAYCTRALLSGLSNSMVAELAGHAGTAMVDRHYGHLGARADLLREAANRVE